ncbi:MAG TPA: glycogen synthase [Sphaerochaeta sp.]|nr:glycogen synthase [Sphaerochaeta sp.]HQB90678.1 glycogen synthase [Sphaerochaeta sp.]
MKICMVSSESVPFSKSGGLADVVGALSTALAALGDDIRVILPLYGSIDASAFKKLDIIVPVSLFSKREEVAFRSVTLDKVIFYFVDHPFYTERGGIYGDTAHAPYDDNLVRYTLLDKAAMALVKALGWKPDVMHCHDWTTGFIPYLMKTSGDDFWSSTKSVMTIHNLAYQGEFSRLDLLGCDIEPDPRLFGGPAPSKRTNMLKSGLEFGDLLSTVSPTYAKEIQSAEYGCGLDSLLRQRSADLVGIINGIDYEEWDPQSDGFMKYHFSADDLRGKIRTKAQIQEYFSLKVDPSIPLFSMISRLASQKGFVELLEGSPSALEQMLDDHPMQMIVIGTGDAHIERQLTELGRRHPNLSVNILFSNKLAHLVEAGSDFFLMPSRYEPCGLNQLYSLRYGTIPVARRTGGLGDSIIDLDENNTEGTGILFDQLTGHGILEAVGRAIAWWEQGEEIMRTIQRRAMQWDSSWNHSATLYRELYASNKRRM